MGFLDTAKTIKDVAQGLASLDAKRSLLEAYDAALALNSKNQELEVRVRELEEALRFKEKVRFDRNALWAEEDPHPYCNSCWEVKENAVHLTQSTSDPEYYMCPSCNKSYNTAVPRKFVLPEPAPLDRDPFQY